MAAPPCCDVLCAGAPGVGKATLLRALQASLCAGKQPGLFRLHLHTKYYEADLLVQCHEEALGSSSTAAAPLDQVQALVLVVDAGSQSSWEYVRRFHESLTEREFDIQLLVATKLDSLLTQPGQTDISGATRPAWLHSAREWGYSHGFEYIEAAAGRPGLDASLQEDGEQQGVARVLAALQAHMWPGMQQKRLQHVGSQPAASHSSSAAVASLGSSSAAARDQGHAAAAAAASASSVTSPQDDSEDLQQQQQPAQHAATLDAVPTQQQASTAGQQAAAAGRQGAAAASAAAAGRKAQSSEQQRSEQAGTAAAGPAAAGLEEEDPFLDADVDDFEQLMRQVMGARARLSALPDEQRRAAAAELALKLSMMMGLGDDSDSGSEDVAVAHDRRP